MKTIKIAVLAMMGMSLGVKAQQWNPNGANTTTGSITINSATVGSHFKRKLDYNGGGWARTLIEYENSLMSSGNFRIGSYGGTTDYRYSYIGYGTYSDKKNLRLYTNGNVAFGGNVGIGTVSPKTKFHISGTENDRILLSNSDVNYNKNSPKLSFFGYTYGTQITGPSIQKIHTNSYGRGRLAIFQHGGTDYTSEKEVMSILPDGNVGIGTSDPKAGLEVRNDDGIKIQSLQNGGWRGSIKMTDGFSNVTSRDDMLFSTAGGFMFKMDDNKNGISTIQGFHIYDRNNNSVFTIKESNGNAALYGKFEAKEIKVTTTPTADFVFEEDYNLPTLSSIEKHIKENKHLPEIASAKEMEKNGVNVGNFQIKLLQKIEELTLYTIAQEKKIKKLEKQNSKMDKQQKEMNAQKKEIGELKVLVQKLLKDKN